MAGSNCNKALDFVVNDILSNEGIEDFYKYWSIAQEIINGLTILSFYCRLETNYVNLAILTDKSIIDIEKKNDQSNSGHVIVTAIDHISDVVILTTPIETLPVSRGSHLTVIASKVGETTIGPYWIAESEKEYESLVQFGKAVTNVIHGKN